LGALIAAGFPISDALTEEVVPLADIYIASISATIRWALACGIPVANYDCYRYRYDDYDSAAAVETFYDWDTFTEFLRRLVVDDALLAQMTERAAADRHNWGIIDGRFVDRFKGILERVSGSKVDHEGDGCTDR